MPATVIDMMTTKLSAPSGCWLMKSRMTPCGRAAADDAEDVEVVIAVMRSPVADARVEHRIEQVDHEIDEDVEHGEHHHHALDQREVRTRHALHEQLADAVQVEYLLGDHQSTDQEGKLDADHGDGGEERVAQSVARDHDFLEYALGARGADVIFVEHLEQR